jgi:hypothetical protein
MKIINIVFFLLLTVNAYSQLAIVNDADGYVNVRYKADKNSKVVSKLQNNEIVYCFEPEGNWVNIDFMTKPEDGNGYVYRDRLKYISNFNDIKPVGLTENSVKFIHDSTCIQLVKSKFLSKQNKLSFDKNNGYNFLTKINGKLFFGTDGEIPKFRYKRFLITIGKDRLKIPISDYNDLYEPNFNSTYLNYDTRSHRYYLSALNSDGAGGYEVVWVFSKEGYIRRYIYYGF